jgi:hypothetical protein
MNALLLRHALNWHGLISHNSMQHGVKQRDTTPGVMQNGIA